LLRRVIENRDRNQPARRPRLGLQATHCCSIAQGPKVQPSLTPAILPFIGAGPCELTRHTFPAGGPDPVDASYSLGLLLGFTFLAGCFFFRFSGAIGAGASLSMFGELFGGTVPEGSAFNACDGWLSFSGGEPFGVATSRSEMPGGAVPEGSVFNACDG
jgi:hypothetical protein